MLILGSVRLSKGLKNLAGIVPVELEVLQNAWIEKPKNCGGGFFCGQKIGLSKSTC